MALSCGASCVKYLLFFFNLLFSITGLIIIIVGAIVVILTHPFTQLTNGGFFNFAPIVLIIIGVIIFIIAFCGCCGAVTENRCMITMFSAILLVIITCELAVGIAGYARRTELKTFVERALNQSIVKYNTNEFTKDLFDEMQIELNCCGINGPNDWTAHDIAIPATCCNGTEIKNNVTVACSLTNPNLHEEGCMPKLVEVLKYCVLLLGGVGVSIAIVQVVGVLFACCLARSIGSPYEFM